CLAARPVDTLWTSPALRLRQGLARGETLKLQFHPDIQVENWDPGSFRLLTATTTPDGGQMLSLVAARAGSDSPKRPSCRCETHGLKLRNEQHSWWHVGPGGSTLTSEITFDVDRGNLYQLSFKLPAPMVLAAGVGQGKAGWLVEKVDMVPADMLQSWV